MDSAGHFDLAEGSTVLGGVLGVLADCVRGGSAALASTLFDSDTVYFPGENVARHNLRLVGFPPLSGRLFVYLAWVTRSEKKDFPLSLTLGTKAKKFQGMVVNFELVGIVELGFQIVNRALIDGNGGAALQTGQVMFVFLGRTIERFTSGQGPYLHRTVELEGIKRAIHGSQANGLFAFAQLNIDILSRERSTSMFEQAENAFLAAGPLGFHNAVVLTHRSIPALASSSLDPKTDK